MPKIRIEGYEFFFYSNEGNEAPHVHIYIDGSELKFWLTDVVLATQNPHIGAHNRRTQDQSHCKSDSTTQEYVFRILA